MRILLSFIVFLLLVSSAQAKVEFSDCGSDSRLRIKSAIEWLVSSLPELDQHLGKRGLANWSGKSRDRFAARLMKNKLRFTCHTGCAAPRFKTSKVGQWSLVTGHGSRIPVCTDRPYDTAQLASVIAHGLGHLVWINAHRRTCLDRCNKPRLATSLMKVVYHVAQGSEYDAAVCMAACGPIPGSPQQAPIPTSELSPSKEGQTPTVP